MNPNWNPAKRTGDNGERRVKRALERLGCRVERVRGRIGFDLEAFARIEAKRDRLAVSTGNVAVELFCDGNPSGISVSSAAFWAFDVGTEILFLREADVRRLAADPRHERREAGDGRRTVVALVPLAVMREAAVWVARSGHSRRAQTPRNASATAKSGAAFESRKHAPTRTESSQRFSARAEGTQTQPADRQRQCVHEWREELDPDGWLRTTCGKCGAFRGRRPGPMAQKQRRREKGGDTW
jgi:hypothetical protein